MESIRQKKSDFWKRMEKLLSGDAELQVFFEALQFFSNEQPPKALRINPLRGDVRRIYELFSALPTLKMGPNLEWCQRAFRVEIQPSSNKTFPNPGTDPLICAGLGYIQEPGACEPVEVLDPHPGDWVLDLCAAPGGKATQIGEKLKGKGYLVANDPVRPRAERLGAMVARHGIANASISALAPESLSEKFPNLFDKVLVDAPCSGESLFAKRQDFRTDIRDADVAGCARRQFLILTHASQMVRPGGRLVYSTCTYSREENEEIVESFLQQNPNWKQTYSKRRWPHIDNAAGGFCAVLENQEVDDPTSLALRDKTKSRFTDDFEGFIRHGWTQWDNSQDLYTYCLAAKEYFPTDYSQFETININRLESLKYLNGETSFASPQTEKKFGIVSFTGFHLGPAKNAGQRWNNLLPKLLRNQS